MVIFIQDAYGQKLCIEFSEDCTAHDYCDNFVSFLRACTFGDATIRAGLVAALANIEDALEVSHNIYKTEVQVTDSDCCTQDS
jgi:hypothetical protein